MMESIRKEMSNYNILMNLAAKASDRLTAPSAMRLRDGGAAGGHVGHGHRAERGDANLVAHDSARKRRRAHLPRQPIRARHQPVSAEIRERLAREPRRADRAADASKEIQGSAVAKQRRRVSNVVSAKPGNDGNSGARAGLAGQAGAAGPGQARASGARIARRRCPEWRSSRRLDRAVAERPRCHRRRRQQEHRPVHQDL